MNKPIEARMSNPRMSQLISVVSERKPLFGKVIATHGAASLGEYAREIRRYEAYDPIQPRSEVVSAVVTEAQRTLGNTFDDGGSIIEKLRAQLESVPLFLTGNHHGPDFGASMHQGTRIFGLAIDADSIIPVLACGTVTLKSKLTRPSGILLADGRRIPFFSTSKYGENTVTSTPPFTSELVDQTIASISGQRGGKLSRKEADAVHEILDEDYRQTANLGLANYSDQSVALNRRLWQRAHSKELDGKVPDLAFLELEGVTKQLLLNDLENSDTITYQSLFDKTLRAKILKNLNNVAGCWNNNEVSADGEVRNQKASDNGTTFFWGIDNSGRRYSLHYTERNEKGYLVGTKKNGSEIGIELTPQAIIDRLQSATESGERIVPSLFTAYLEVAFAHGFKCEGGPKQIEYLTSMKKGLAAALEMTGKNYWAEKIGKVPTENYVSGLAMAYANYPDESVQRAGLVEVISQGGYVRDDLATMESMTLEDSALSISAKLYPDLVAEDERDPELEMVDEKVIYEYLGDKAINIKV